MYDQKVDRFLTMIGYDREAQSYECVENRTNNKVAIWKNIYEHYQK